jgi:hypothetical protein
MVTDGQDFTTYQPDLTHPHVSARQVLGPLIATPRGILSIGQVAREPGSSNSEVI